MYYTEEPPTDSNTFVRDSDIIDNLSIDRGIGSTINNIDVNYEPNRRLDYDNPIIPKEENLMHVECPDFHEFNRTFHCKRRELCHFIKGLAEEKHFKLR